MTHPERGYDCATKHVALFYKTHQEHQGENAREKNLLTEAYKKTITKKSDSQTSGD